MRRTLVAAALLASLGTVAAARAEVIDVPFMDSTPVSTASSYFGEVTVTVSGFGQSDGAALNDAFYVFTDQSEAPTTPQDRGYYDLGFGTGGSISSIDTYVTPAPAYNPSHTYNIDIDTGLTTPSQLDFGVVDDIFYDNTGTFTISVSEAPEPSTWALMIAGVGMVGGALRLDRRRGALAPPEPRYP